MAKVKVVKKFYHILKDMGANDKCPPQARLILETIKANGTDNRIGREELLTLLKRVPEAGGLRTNQTAERILGFYRPRLTAAGVLKEETETVETEVPDPPAKEAAATGGEPAGEGAAPTAEGGATAQEPKGKPKKGEHKAA